MKYDFDRIIDRRGTGCFKYDALKLFFGKDELIPLWVADMDFSIAPEIEAALLKRLQHPVFGYNFRPKTFYDAVIEWFETRFGYRIQREWIIATPGIVPAINLAVLCFTAPGDSILIQTPVYQPFFEAVLAHKRTLLTNPLIEMDGRFEIDFEDLELKLQKAKLFIFCSPHNPVGRVWTRDELQRIGGLCAKYGVPVVSDDIHCDIVYKPHKHLPLAGLDGFESNVVSCFSPSKSFNIAGLTTAVVVISDPEKRRIFNTLNQDLHLYLGNSFGIEAFIAAYKSGQNWLDELVLYLEKNRDFLVRFVRNDIPELKVICPEGTFLAWMDFRGLQLSTEAMNRMLIEKAGVALDPGIKYGIEGEGFMRFNFGCSQAVVMEALSRIQLAIREL
ncbi:MAG: PatB family C-S lyase [Candidatus Cloacimonetes bacterium]|nr:PatB family C-S lyase [Candidatus Cloacimonadota bacterium]